MISIAMNCDSAKASCLLNTPTLGLIHLAPNRHPGERWTHRDKTKKEPTLSNCRLFLSSPNAFPALWHGSFVPRERLVANGAGGGGGGG